MTPTKQELEKYIPSFEREFVVCVENDPFISDDAREEYKVMLSVAKLVLDHYDEIEWLLGWLEKIKTFKQIPNYKEEKDTEK